MSTRAKLFLKMRHSPWSSRKDEQADENRWTVGKGVEQMCRVPLGAMKKRRSRIEEAEQSYSPEWIENAIALQAVLGHASRISRMEFEISMLRLELNSIKTGVRQRQSTILPINTFAPEPYALAKPILLSVDSTEDGATAGWIDANIHSSGDSEEEAVANLKSLILDFFDQFSSEESQLGPEPKRQLSVLKTFIRKSEAV
jgi:hypothetical protein